MKTIKTYFILLVFIFIASCSNQKNSNDRIIIGISEDVDSFNPMYSFKVNEGRFADLLFLSLVKHKWDDQMSNLYTDNVLAENISWNGDSTQLEIKLRKNVKWSDGKDVTTDDVIFSFAAYSHPDVQSKFFGTFKNFSTTENGQIDIEKTFEKKSDLDLIVKFKPNSIPSLLDIDQPILPKHKFDSLDYSDYETADFNSNPVTNGPYKLAAWNKNSYVQFERDDNSFLLNPKSVKKIFFKVIPDYKLQLLQLKNGEIDFIENVKPDDAEQLLGSDYLVVEKVKGREYDYIGWNNIDIDAFEENKIRPNKYFGKSKIRKALTHAVNRKVILDEYLYNFGQLAVSPVTPIFKDLIDDDISPYDYDPELAKKILSEEGWIDTNFDGFIEKNGVDFRFTLNIPSGNPRREFAATVIKNNLKAVGINVEINSLELGQFIDNLYDKKMNAWMAAWYVPIPIDLMVYWHSDLEKGPLNFPTYKNSRVDKILEHLEKKVSIQKKKELLKEFQKIVHDDEPVTFLYWIDNVVVYNKRIKNVNVTPLGAIQDCWEWTLAE